MAQKAVVRRLDDLSGEEAQETVLFALDGTRYEIDLTAAHATELRDLLQPYVAQARRLPDRPGSRAPNGFAVREENKRIRQWARNNGYSPRARGRISQDVRRAYYAAQG